MKEDLSNLVGKKCPHCEDGYLFMAGPMTVGCSHCEHLEHVGFVPPIPGGRRIVISTWDPVGHERHFSAPVSVGYEILHSIGAAYVNLEAASVGWSGADGTDTIYHMLCHLMECQGIKEGDDELPTLHVNGEDSWQDGSICGGEIK